MSDSRQCRIDLSSTSLTQNRTNGVGQYVNETFQSQTKHKQVDYSPVSATNWWLIETAWPLHSTTRAYIRVWHAALQVWKAVKWIDIACSGIEVQPIGVRVEWYTRHRALGCHGINECKFYISCYKVIDLFILRATYRNSMFVWRHYVYMVTIETEITGRPKGFQVEFHEIEH